ncbi:MAG TPA: antitermination regulator [Lachnoclostridium phytofermentans]|uniref:Antitermination regulator n=1 Tax=Lachnoclostridium phytofermentans TaxID=66219 RepID=A0A3D2XB57_9FIRM|nr:ANTAR domain-containing protein [Lachnoclostridium sp.]HCL03987.1 antitermination regulator [Lachnoclostridium phytofermentans]
MLSIIIAFPKIEDANNIRNILVSGGFEVNATCTTGAQAIMVANELDEGIVICGFRLPDMIYLELNGYLPRGFEMLLLASPQKLLDCADGNILSLSMPIKIQDLLNTLQLMTYKYMRRKKRDKNKPKDRTTAQLETITRAKELLMERNKMTEEEAHRYIQKTSMDSGTDMVETAEMILTMM